MVKVAIGIIFNANGECLVTERPSTSPYAGWWEFPGGKIEAGETPLDALHRELKEEIGISVIEAKILLVHEHVYPERTVELHVWLVSAFSGEPQPCEQQAMRWCKPQDIAKLQFLPGNQKILERLLAEMD